MSAICICDNCGKPITPHINEAKFTTHRSDGRVLQLEIKPVNGALDICLACAIDALLKLTKPEERVA